MMDYPEMSPYCAFNNNPVFFVDPYGLEGTPNKDGKQSGPIEIDGSFADSQIEIENSLPNNGTQTTGTEREYHFSSGSTKKVVYTFNKLLDRKWYRSEYNEEGDEFAQNSGPVFSIPKNINQTIGKEVIRNQAGRTDDPMVPLPPREPRLTPNTGTIERIKYPKIPKPTPPKKPTPTKEDLKKLSLQLTDGTIFALSETSGPTSSYYKVNDGTMGPYSIKDMLEPFSKKFDMSNVNVTVNAVIGRGNPNIIPTALWVYRNGVIQQLARFGIKRENIQTNFVEDKTKADFQVIFILTP